MKCHGFGTQSLSGCYHAVVNALVLLSVKKKSGTPLKDMECMHLQCDECWTKIDYQAKFARGEPRNIALIRHWDGWQPFGAPGQHSCGKQLSK